jgi:hypothetical protein
LENIFKARGQENRGPHIAFDAAQEEGPQRRRLPPVPKTFQHGV